MVRMVDGRRGCPVGGFGANEFGPQRRRTNIREILDILRGVWASSPRLPPRGSSSITTTAS